MFVHGDLLQNEMFSLIHAGINGAWRSSLSLMSNKMHTSSRPNPSFSKSYMINVETNHIY